MYGESAQIPSALRRNARWERLTDGGVPALVVHPDRAAGSVRPVVLWMHGRTVHKELDPGRYLRWMRAGIGACAVDLPGHGQRFDADLQAPDRTLDVVTRMLAEIDPLVEALGAMGVFDMNHLAIGGVSAGGMTALARLCRDHPFLCTSVEATSGSWRHQHHRPMFKGREDEADTLDPITHLDDWREIPLQALHARYDEWVPVEGQTAFIDELRRRYQDPDLVDFIEYDETGAPHEHAGFGRMAAEAKNRQTEFLRRWLVDTS